MNPFGKELSESVGSIERWSTLISHVLVSIMLACVAASIAQLGSRMSPGWDGRFLPWVILVISFEAMHSKRISNRLTLFSPEWFTFRGVEIVVLLILLKALLYLVSGPAQLAADLKLWQEDFLVNFFTPGYVGLVLISFLFWALSGRLSDILFAMEGDLILLEEDIPVGFNQDRQAAREQLFDIILFLGAFMVLLTSAVRIDLEAVWGSRPPIHGSVFTLIMYFVIALVLLSQTQFSILRAGWTRERISLSRNLGKRWLSSSLVFLLLLAGVVFLLPTRYSLGLLSILNYLFGLLLYGFFAIWGLIMLAATAILRLFGAATGETGSEPRPVLPPRPDVLASPSEPLPWLELMKSTLFWVIFLGVILFSLYQFLKQRQDLWVKLRIAPGLPWLATVWSRFKRWLKGMNRKVGAAVAGRLQSIRRTAPGRALVEPWRFINLRRLSPRERVLFFYLALVRRSKERGISRGESQTPYEYEKSLLSALPGSEEELAGITGAFVEARYSLHPVEEHQASKVRNWWQRLRRLLNHTAGQNN